MQNIKRLSCYAVLHSDNKDQNHLYPHMKLVMFLIYKKKYTKITTQTIMDDFVAEYGYVLNYFATIKILGMGLRSGYLSKPKNRAMYVPTEKIDEFSEVSNDLGNSETLIKTLITQFQAYAASKEISYSYDECEVIVTAYIQNQKFTHLSSHIDKGNQDRRVDYLFASFMRHIKHNESEIYTCLTNIVIGSILADYITYAEEVENGKTLEHQIVYIDSDIGFRLLGIDTGGRQGYYIELVKALQAKGAMINIFAHSRDEMQRVILGAADWIESNNYDASKASSTAHYFRSIKATKAQVIEFSTKLDSLLAEHKVGIEHITYVDDQNKYQEDEQKIYNLLIEHYKQKISKFDETSQKNTVELDAKSVSLVFRFRQHEYPVRIADASRLFVTSNVSIAEVAREYNRVLGGRWTKVVPVAITDIFLGSYLWLNDPVKICEMNEMQMSANAYYACQPNSALIRKLTDSVNRLFAMGKIDAETCYMMKSDQLVYDVLTDMTLGDADAFTDNTPEEIMKEIQEAAKEEGREERQKEIDELKMQFDEKLKSISHDQAKGEINTIEMTLLYLREAKKNRERELADITTIEHNISRKQIFLKSILHGCVVLLGIMLLAAITIIWLLGNQLDLDILAYVLAAFSILAYVFSALTTKKISIKKIIDIFLDKYYRSLCMRYNYSENKKSETSEGIYTLSGQIKEKESEIVRLKTQTCKQYSSVV